MTDHVTTEREKYAKIYEFPGYGTKGHGAPIAGLLLERATGRGILGDFGCGRGGSFAPYLAAGFRIQPIDHVDVVAEAQRLHPQVLTPWVANLWADPLPVVDYGICTDVAEHIPEEHVPGMIANISRAVRNGCLWSVCHVKDVWGDRIGTRLHMTIRDGEWWKQQFSQHWARVEVIRTTASSSIYWTVNGDLAQSGQRPSKAAA